MTRRLPHFLRDRSGAAAAEMALLLPLALVLLFATFEGAYYVMCEHRVVKGVRDAARYAARLDFDEYIDPTNPSGPTCLSTFGGDEAAVKNLARTGQLSGGNPAVYGWTDADVTISVSCATGTGGLYETVSGNAPQVTVSADVAYPSLFGTLGLATTDFRLKASAQSAVMGL